MHWWQHADVGNLAWSLVTFAVSAFGLWLSGRNVKHGWAYGIASQVLWATEGLATGRPGDIALSVVFVGMYVRNLRRWRHSSGRPEPVPALPPACPRCAAAGRAAPDGERMAA